MKLDVTRELGLVTRAVQMRVQQGRPARVVFASHEYATALADVWDAITNPERLPRWFLPVSGELRVGGRYQLQGNAGGEIQLCAALRQLALTWEFGSEISWLELQLSVVTAGSPAAGSPAAGSPVAEAPAAAHTRLELRHIAHIGADRWEQFGPGAVGVGWDLALRGLRRHLAGGGSVEHGVAFTWLASEEGKQFVRQSSADWGRAAIAAGEVAEIALAAAARTTAAYTGETVPAASTRG